MAAFQFKSMAAALLAFSILGCNKTTSPAPNSSEKQITLLYPRGGETFEAGKTIVIKWSTKGMMVDAVDVEFSLDDGKQEWATLNTDGAIRPTDSDWGNFSWTVTDSLELPSSQGTIKLANNSKCRIRVRQFQAKDSLQISTTPEVFTVTILDPFVGGKQIALLYPLGGESFKVGQTVQIKWAVKGNLVNNVDVELSPNDGMIWTTMNQTGSIDPTDSNWGNYSWIVTDSLEQEAGQGNVELVNNSKCRIRVRQYSTGDPNKIAITEKTFTVLP